MTVLTFEFVAYEEDDYIPYEPHLKALIKPPKDICTICMRLLFYRHSYAIHYRFGFGNKGMCASCCEINQDFPFYDKAENTFKLCTECKKIEPPLYRVSPCKECGKECHTCTTCETTICQGNFGNCDFFIAQWAHIVFPMMSWLVSPKGRENDQQFQMAIASYKWIFTDKRFRRACDATVYNPFDIARYILGWCHNQHKRGTHKPGEDCYTILWQFMYTRLCDVMGVSSLRSGRGNWPHDNPKDWRFSEFIEELGGSEGDFGSKMWEMNRYGITTNYKIPGAKPVKVDFGNPEYDGLPVPLQQYLVVIPDSPFQEIPLPRPPNDNYNLYEERMRLSEARILEETDDELLAPVVSISPPQQRKVETVIVVPDPEPESEEILSIVEVEEILDTIRSHSPPPRVVSPEPIQFVNFEMLGSPQQDYYDSPIVVPPIIPPSPVPSPALSDKILHPPPPIVKRKRGRPRKNPLPPSSLGQNVTLPQ